MTITLNFTGNPETTRVANATPNASVTVVTVGSLYQPYNNEPFAVNRTLSASGGATYQTGAAASEGARIVTSAGTVTRCCP